MYLVDRSFERRIIRVTAKQWQFRYRPELIKAATTSTQKSIEFFGSTCGSSARILSQTITSPTKRRVSKGSVELSFH